MSKHRQLTYALLLSNAFAVTAKRTNDMAAHPVTVSRVRTFVDVLKQWAEEPWAKTVDVPFVIGGCTERSVIFDLRFRMTVPDGDPVLLRDDVIGRRLRWEGVEEAIAPWERGAGCNEAPAGTAKGAIARCTP